MTQDSRSSTVSLPRPRAVGWVRLGALLTGLLTVGSCGGSSGTEVGVGVLTFNPGTELLVGVGASSSLRLLEDGSSVPSGLASWSSDDPSVATVSTSGRVTAVGAGLTRIRAEYRGSSATADVEVFLPIGIDPAAVGTEFEGRQGYVTYIPGTLPLLITAGHGGSERPTEIPDRGFGVTGADRNTLQLTLAIRDEFREQTGHTPHLVLSQLHRIKLDPNREIVEAAQGSVFAEQAWREFHEWSEIAREHIQTEFGSGFYVDIHGHGHPIDRVELGYLLNSSDLSRSDASLNGAPFISKSSYRHLSAVSPLTFAELIRGPKSVGAFLALEGVPSVPSPANPDPGDEPFFSGGFNTVLYGSRNGGTVSGVQFEHHFTGIRDTAANRAAYAERFAKVIRAFMLEHYGFFEPTG